MSAFSLCFLCLLAFIVLVEKLAFCFIVVRMKSNVLYSLPNFKDFLSLRLCMCLHMCVCAWVLYLSCLGFVELFDLCRVFNQVWKILRRYSFKCCYCPVFYPIFLITHSWCFLIRPTYLLCSVQWFSFFFIFFSAWTSVSDPCFWQFEYLLLGLSFPNWVFSSCCFTFKTSNKFLIADTVFFNYRMSILFVLFCRFQDCWNYLFIHLFTTSCFKTY